MRSTAHSMSKSSLLLAEVLLIACGTLMAQSPTYKLGRTPTDAEIRAWDHAVGPAGRELPAGSGTAVEGAKMYASKCSFCHGKNAEGIFPFPRLAGGNGTYNTPNPVRSSASYLPYATTIWDFINRAMPRDAEGTLAPDEIYAVTAFILFKNGTIKDTDVMDKKTLPEVVMPNRYGFYPDPPQSAPDKGRGWLPYWNQVPLTNEAKPASKDEKASAAH
jgi:mono/diheme cytochrome c family protein